MKRPEKGATLFGAGALCSLLASGCRDDTSIEKPTPSLERMLEQPRWDAFESRSDSDRPARLLPPRGSVPYAFGGAPNRETNPMGSNPFELDAKAMQEGSRWYRVYCAPCHGIDGAGITTVTRLMPHPPRPLFAGPDQLVEREVYRVITEGVGKMPSLETQMTRRERWLVVAYVKSLEETQRGRAKSKEHSRPADEQGEQP